MIVAVAGAAHIFAGATKEQALLRAFVCVHYFS